jgi:hypothetical protein
VPIYEVLKVPGEDDKVILVMPLLRGWDEPAFETVGEGIDFFQQLFEVWGPTNTTPEVFVEFPRSSGLAIHTPTTCCSPV